MPTSEFIAAKIREAAEPTVGPLSDHDLQFTEINVTALPYNRDLVPPEDELVTEEGAERMERVREAVERVRSVYPRID